MGTLKVDEIRSTSAHDDANAITLSGNNATLTSNVVFPTGPVSYTHLTLPTNIEV